MRSVKIAHASHPSYPRPDLCAFAALRLRTGNSSDAGVSAPTRFSQGGRGDGDRARHDGRDAPEGGHRPGHHRRRGGRHPCRRRIDDGRSRDDEHALPQRRGRDLLCLDAAVDPCRREEGRARRQAFEMAARCAACRPGHPRAAGPNDLRLRRLRHRQHGVRKGAVRGPVPAVGTRPAPRLRHVEAASIRAGHELELRTHQLRAAGQGAGKGDRGGHAEVVGRQGVAAARADQHRQLVHPRDPGAGSARVHQRTPGGAQDTRRHTVLRRVDVLESVVDDHPRRHPDDEHLRHGGQRVRAGIGQAAVEGLLREVRVHRPARQDPRPARLHDLHGR